MGFSDTATYIRASQIEAVKTELSTILGSFGFVRAAPGTTQIEVIFDHRPLAEVSTIHVWLEKASNEFIRLYASHYGLFLIHEEDFVPILERLAAALETDAFEISVNDGDSVALLETDGTQSRLTGCHSYVLDDLYDRSPDMEFSPGDVFSLRGVPFPFDGLEIDAGIVPELFSHDFGFFMDTVITGVEIALFGRQLPSYYEFHEDSPTALRHDVLEFRRPS